MGHGYSHWRGSDEDEEREKDEQNGSNRPKLASSGGSRRILRRAFRSTGSRNELKKYFTKQEQFSGIVRITLFSAEMEFKDKWFACVSLGEQTFRTATSSNTEKPEWNSKKNIVLESNGPRMVRVTVFETNRFSKNNLVGYCDLDLSTIFDNPDTDHSKEVHQLYDPNYGVSKVVGKITLGYDAQDREETETGFARRLLSLVDYDDNGELSLDEFRDLIKAFGNKISQKELEQIYSDADTNHDGRVSADELAELIAMKGDRAVLVKRCPVCGETLQSGDELNDIIHMTLCFDEGTGNGIMTGGFLTEKQASYGWMFKLSEWANLSSYDAGGLNTGASAAYIVVFDRKSKRLVEELIDRKIVLSLRAIYQSKLTLALIDNGTKNLLVNMSKKQGERMAKPESANDIPRFIEFFQDRIKVEEFKYPVEYYKTFNDFFVRELKPGCRPIAHEDNDAVAVSGADCRLIAFNSADDATRFWIKGRKFSIKGLLGSDEIAKDFEGGTLVIFRLAPQDYHRFHVPVSGKIESILNIPGHLYTVNPIAVNSKYCNVFTENKRAVTVISTREFGKVAFVAIGATMVGSITFTKNLGDTVKKGDEYGYFSFGGSTCIVVFQEGAIELDEDLVANSERSLETLVMVGESLGVARKYSDEVNEHMSRPSVRDSVVGLDSDVAKKGVQDTSSFIVNGGHLGLGESGYDSPV
ncbi:hypothetical protein R1sor_026049 [Riccia sorocarpa]|uniref:Phosphatidylserine decarboxylase proenzyme 2 n=1 Tax=Riccia sorocarpa TaxID=122646 RepID=A0ABD3GBQ2_9MARC